MINLLFVPVGLPPSTLSPLWCRNCDCKHADGHGSCPLRAPVAVFQDSVIDFSGGEKEREQEPVKDEAADR